MKKMDVGELRKLKANLLEIDPNDLELHEEKMTKRGLIVMWNVKDKQHILYESTVAIWIRTGGR